MNLAIKVPGSSPIASEQLGQPLQTLPLVFFDLETTGLFPTQGHRVCEVALLRVQAETVQARLNTLVDPQRPVGVEAFAVNGISSELLKGAPIFATIAESVQELLEGAVLVAHNAPFDMAFLAHELELLGQPAPQNLVLDTLVLARRLLTRRQSYSLRALAETLALPMPHHRAMSDVLALQALFVHLLRLMHERRVVTLGDALRLQRGLLPGQPDPVPHPLIGQALLEGRFLRIVYRSRTSPEPTERLIQPLELTQESNGVYLRAFCFLRDNWRSFAVDKIEAMELV